MAFKESPHRLGLGNNVLEARYPELGEIGDHDARVGSAGKKRLEGIAFGKVGEDRTARAHRNSLPSNANVDADNPMTTRRCALRTILDTLEQPNACFVLGAGTSVPIVPIATQLSERVRRRLLSIGIFPTTPVARDSVTERILGPPRSVFDLRSHDQAIEEELVARHVSPAAVHAAFMAEVRPQSSLVLLPQYSVFGLSKFELSLINFNVDGLADEYCSNHLVINMHGTSPSAEHRKNQNWDALIDGLQEFHEIPPLRIGGLLLPQPEPASISLSTEFGIAWASLNSAARLVLVGYSFGGMDDREAYALITRAIRLRKLETVVLSPDPTDLAFRIQDDASWGGVAAFPGYWDKLSAAIISSIGRPRRKSCDHARLCLSCVEYLYEAFLDAGA
jgi:hypothetical protein